MPDLSICLPFAPPALGGGGYGFLRMWEAWLTKERIPWSRKITDRHPVLFVNSWQTHPLKVFAACALRPRVTAVHRVDGWPPLYGRTDGSEKKLIKVNRLADLTIYQSKWAQSVIQPMLQKCNGRDSGLGPVIYNPVDVEMFRPDGLTRPRPVERPGPHVAVVSWSDNQIKGREAIRRLVLAYPDVNFILCGRMEISGPNIARMGVLSSADLAMTLRSCDVLLTMSQHEACPNHVLEAMACGLPVLYLDSGAMREIVGPAGRAVTEDDFRVSLEGVKDRNNLIADPRSHVLKHFSPSVIFPQYLDAIRRAMR